MNDLSPEQEALLVGLYESREAVDNQLSELKMIEENRKKIYGLQNTRNKIVNQINSIIFSSDKEYADEEFGYQVFKYIADNPQMDNTKRDNIKMALESAREACKKEPEWVDEVKGNKYLFTKKNLKTLSENGDLKLLMKFKTLKKTSITNRSTLNSAAGEFSDQKSVAERLQDHTNRIKTLERDTMKLSKNQEAQQAHLKLIDEILGDNSPDWKHKALILKDQGFSQDAISSSLGISISTVKRHWSSLK